ncbi:MAG: SapC family protein [Pseudomonadota bacterium]
MARFQVVSRKQYADKRLKKAANLFFARQDNVLHIGATELPKVMMYSPIAFLTTDGSQMPVALQGLVTGQNLFVAGDGRWLGGYVPAMYLCYPFRLARVENNELVLCVDEDSGLITEASSGEGELFFDEDQKPTAIITGVVNNLNQIEQDIQNTRAMCAILQKYELFEPWPIQIQSGDDVQNMEGLSRINEVRLNALPGEALVELCTTQALKVAYCQLFSMNNLQQLGKLAFAHAQSPKSKISQAGGSIDFGMLEDTGSISFDNL